MTLPVWPFKRQRAGGYVDAVDVPSGAELTAIDEQISRAANGLVWSDVALLKNFGPSQSKANATSAIAFDPVRRQWFVLGQNATPAPKGWISQDTANSWTALDFSGYANMTINCAAANGLGRVAFGFTPAAAGTSKIMYSDDGFTTHSAAGAIGASSTVGCTALMYSQRLGLWVAGMSDGSIYTSPNLSTAFTLRHATDGFRRTAFAESADRIMSVNGIGGTTGCLTSLDGITWTAITVPAVAGSPGLCFVPQPDPGYFVLSWGTGAGSGSTASSVDGVAWTTASSVNYPISIGTAVAYGRMLAVVGADPTDTFYDVYYSLDLGISFKRSGSIYLPILTAALLLLAQSDDQFLAVGADASNNALIYRGSRGGL